MCFYEIQFKLPNRRKKQQTDKVMHASFRRKFAFVKTHVKKVVTCPKTTKFLSKCQQMFYKIVELVLTIRIHLGYLEIRNFAKFTVCRFTTTKLGKSTTNERRKAGKASAAAASLWPPDRKRPHSFFRPLARSVRSVSVSKRARLAAQNAGLFTKKRTLTMLMTTVTKSSNVYLGLCQKIRSF